MKGGPNGETPWRDDARKSEGSPGGHPAERQPIAAGDAGKVDFTAAGGATVARELHTIPPTHPV
jgi:hypothetical protein